MAQVNLLHSQKSSQENLNIITIQPEQTFNLAHPLDLSKWEIVFREDFSGEFNISNDINLELDSPFISIDVKSSLGTPLENVVGTQLRVNDSFGQQMGLPVVVDVDNSEDGKALQLPFDTYNPSALTPGDSYFGSGIKTKNTYSIGEGLAFEAQVRLVDSQENPLPGGIIASLFSFTPNAQDERDEVNFELLSNDITKIFTNSFDDDDFSQRGDFEYIDFANYPQLNGVDLTDFVTLRIEILPDESIKYIVNDVVIREETETIPDENMSIYLNIWANGFPEAFNESLIPTSQEDQNKTYFYEVDYVQVETLAKILIVDTTEDQNDGDTDNGLSLREAILIANGDLENDYIIKLTAGETYSLTIKGAQENAGLTGDLDITAGSNIKIEAVGRESATIDAQEIDRVVHNRGSLRLDNVIITGGLPSGSIHDNRGAGIFNYQGKIELINTTITNNKTKNTFV